MEVSVEELVEKYGTRDPFEIAEKMGVTVIYEELGNITAYYNRAFGKKFIHVNESTKDTVRQSHPVACMLYHAITEPEYDVIYIRDKNKVELTELETKAEKFASELLEHRKHAIQFDTFDEYVKSSGLDEKTKQDLYDWVMRLTKDVDCPKYTECDTMNRILYMIDKIEGR